MKDTKNESPQVEKGLEQEYFFPTHGVTIKATSKEEAEQKLFDTLKEENKK